MDYTMITFCNLCQIFGYFVGNGVALHLRDFLSFFQSELSVISKLIYIYIYIYKVLVQLRLAQKAMFGCEWH